MQKEETRSLEMDREDGVRSALAVERRGSLYDRGDHWSWCPASWTKNEQLCDCCVRPNGNPGGSAKLNS